MQTNNDEELKYTAKYVSRLEAIIEGQVYVLEMISRNVPIQEVLEGIIKWVESHSDGEVMGSILLADEEGKSLLHCAAPSLPDFYNAAAHGLPIGYGQGSCGTAAFLKEQVIVDDIATSPLWSKYLPITEQAGLGACWSTPLIGKNGNLLGTFAMYFRTPRKPTDNDLHIIKLVGRTIVIAIEHNKIEDEQQKLQGKILDERHNFYQLLMDAPAVIAVLSGPEHVYELANKKYMETIGNHRQILGKPIREALPELGEVIYNLLDEVYTTGQPYTAHELEVGLDRAGSGILEAIYFNFIYQPIRDQQGNVFQILVHAIDVTTQVKARQKLAEAEYTQRNAIEVAQLGTWQYNPLTRETTYSDRILEWFGFAAGEQVGMDRIMRQVVCPDVLKDAVANTLVPGSDGTINTEYEIISFNDGQRRTLHTTGRVFLDEMGKPYMVVGTSQDITAHKQLQRELETEVQERTKALSVANEELKAANQNLERVNRNLEQFAYVTSHDLQEPLRKIRIFSDILQTRSEVVMNNFTKKYLDKIESSVERMSALITDLLNFSRIEKSGKTFTVTNLNTIINEVMEDFDLAIRDKHVILNVTPLLEIQAVPLEMRQLFFNLIGNAIKFSRKDLRPVINISGRVLPNKEVQSDKLLNPRLTYYAIEVIDNGIGFEPKYADQIFTIFQRLHTRESYSGTGIGLALCQQVVNNHQGRIYAEGRENNGARFVVILPINR
jgi:signal transduction histidine kinase